jgi:hypothetical protein
VAIFVPVASQQSIIQARFSAIFAHCSRITGSATATAARAITSSFEHCMFSTLNIAFVTSFNSSLRHSVIFLIPRFISATIACPVAYQSQHNADEAHDERIDADDFDDCSDHPAPPLFVNVSTAAHVSAVKIAIIQ